MYGYVECAESTRKNWEGNSLEGNCVLVTLETNLIKLSHLKKSNWKTEVNKNDFTKALTSYQLLVTDGLEIQSKHNLSGL